MRFPSLTDLLNAG